MLKRRADLLIAIEREQTGEPTEEPAHELARALAIWSISLDHLHAAGVGAWKQMDPLSIERAQLALLSSTAIGDIVLDAFAWAELVRRREWRSWRHRHVAQRCEERAARRARRKPRNKERDRVPVPWTILMSVLDDGDADDRMIQPARYLDVTLDAARDLLVAHRDPELMLMRGASSYGPPTLDLRTLDRRRLAAALALVATIPSPFPRPRPQAGAGWIRHAIDQEVSRHIALAGRLDGQGRKTLRRVLRLVGAHSPDMSAIANGVLQLVDDYIDRRSLRGEPKPERPARS